MTNIQVAILTGSDSDLPEISAAAQVLEQFGVRHEMRILSAHRTPEQTAAYVKDAEARGARVFICAAGMAAHLAGAVAAHTTRPVIGVPMGGGLMGGLDALLSTVQMPPGVPVLTTAVGKAGAINAGLAAVQILACSRPAGNSLSRKLDDYKKEMQDKVLEKDRKLQEKGSKALAK
ncbi:MAG: 5-(carboxyamino)imidazole ribonucleotide mutase [Candidatus Sumerlaeota bacterium]|nr:5-(carboxyamino)imidazole ribonucleotide mutase [Candidatus Sumerlaeota bacterium]